MFKYCINRGRFVSVDASIKSDAKTGASERKRPFKLTSERASRRDNMKPKEKRERKLKAWILKYIRNLKKLPKLPKPNKEGKIGIKWLQVEEDIYLTAKDQFYGIYGYGNDKDWNDGKMSWVFWYVCDEVENLINKLKQKSSEQKG